MDPKSINKPLKNHLKIEVRKQTVQNRKKMRPGAKKGAKTVCESSASICLHHSDPLIEKNKTAYVDVITHA